MIVADVALPDRDVSTRSALQIASVGTHTSSLAQGVQFLPCGTARTSTYICLLAAQAISNVVQKQQAQHYVCCTL